MSLSFKHPLQQRIGGTVAVLLGGRSAEREISLKSGAAILTALKNSGIDVVAIDTADNGWQQSLAQCGFAFIALHGPGGEDGTLQGALELLGIPYSGSGVLASALAMDKLRTKQLWRGIGLPTPDFEILSADSDWQALALRFGQSIVKPAREGSSIGMSRAANAEELQRAYALAAPYGEVLVEQWVDGEEYTVAVLGGAALPAIRLETANSFYDFEAKYQSNETLYHCPCGLTDIEEAELQALALQAFDSLGCRDWGRVDVMRHADGTFYLLEVNTIPGMTDHSLVPMAARQHGLNFDELVLKILEVSVERTWGDHGGE